MSKQKIHDIIIKKKRPSIKMFARKEPTSTPPPKQSRKSKKERGWFAIFGKGKLVFMFVVFFLIIVLSTKAVDLFAKTIKAFQLNLITMIIIVMKQQYMIHILMKLKI